MASCHTLPPVPPSIPPLFFVQNCMQLVDSCVFTVLMKLKDLELFSGYVG